MRGRDAVTRRDAAPDEGEGRNRAGRERRRGPECVSAISERSQRESAYRARSQSEEQQSLRHIQISRDLCDRPPGCDAEEVHRRGGVDVSRNHGFSGEAVNHFQFHYRDMESRRKSYMRLSLAFPLIAFLAGANLGDTMNPNVVECGALIVVGIAARTSNAREMTAEGIIGRQWGRLMQEGLLAKIPNKADHNIIAVYTDYASDHNGEYTYVLGARVKSDEAGPTGMGGRKIPAGKFAVFRSEKGAAAKVVPETWMKINSLPRSAGGGDRVYRADYEIYDERAADPANSQVDVYVAIK